MSFDSPIYIVFLIGVCLAYWRLRLSPAEFPAAPRELFLLRVVGLALPALMAARRPSTSCSRAPLIPRIKSAQAIHADVRGSEPRVLGFFKYFNFFVGSFLHIADALGLGGLPHSFWSIVLPPAISFYTFQEVAYIVDVYERSAHARDSLSITRCSSVCFLT